LPADYLSREIAKAIEEAVAKLPLPPGPEGDPARESIQGILKDCVDRFLKLQDGNHRWLEAYRREPRLDELRRELQTQAGPKLIGLALAHRSNLGRSNSDSRPGRGKAFRPQGGLSHEEVQRAISAGLRGLHHRIVEVVKRSATARGEDFLLVDGSPEERRSFAQQYLCGLKLPEAIRALLPSPYAPLPEIFEDCLGNGVVRAIKESGVCELVAGVYQGVVLSRDEDAIAELDTLVLFRNGQLAVVEAKTHYENAAHKQIQGSIKQFRDCGGVYGSYWLVFPLLQEEIGALASGDPSLVARWREAGIEDTEKWVRYARHGSSGRDAKMVGLDQLGAEIRSLVRRWRRQPVQEPPDPPTLVVHPYVDLDACACVALAGADPQQVRFLAANATTLPEDFAHARVLDHDSGVKGHRERDGTVHAAALSMPEAAELLRSDLMAEIDEQDRFGRVERPRFSLGTILAGLRQEFLAAGLEGEPLDQAILGAMVPVLRGLIRLERQRERIESTVETSPVVEVGPWRFAVRDHSPNSFQSPSAPVTGECVGMVYHEGFNLGVYRYPGQPEPDLHCLAPHVPGWFSHPGGFLTCWGSRKAPATSPPPGGTPQTVEELIDLMRNVLV
jgi:hypothetical protein